MARTTLRLGRPDVAAIIDEKHAAEKDGWRWLKEAGGILLVPRPSHSKKDPAAADDFRQGLAGYLENFKLPEGSRVKVWMMVKPDSDCTPRCGGFGRSGESARW